MSDTSSEQSAREKKVRELVLELDVMARAQGLDVFSAEMVAVVEGVSNEQWAVLAGNVTARRLQGGDTARCHPPSDVTVAEVLRVYRDRLEAEKPYQLTNDDRVILHEFEAAP